MLCFVDLVWSFFDMDHFDARWPRQVPATTENLWDCAGAMGCCLKLRWQFFRGKTMWKRMFEKPNVGCFSARFVRFVSFRPGFRSRMWNTQNAHPKYLTKYDGAVQPLRPEMPGSHHIASTSGISAMSRHVCRRRSLRSCLGMAHCAGNDQLKLGDDQEIKGSWIMLNRLGNWC